MISKPQTPRQQAEAHLLERKIGLYSALSNWDSKDLTGIEREILRLLVHDRQIKDYLRGLNERLGQS